MTEWLEFPRNKVFRIKLLAAFELADYVERHLATIENWAVQNGATRIQVHGRRAWAKLLEDGGYSIEALMLVKDTVGGQA